LPPPPELALSEAVALAAAQLARLDAGDMDGFLACEQEYLDACEAAAALATEAGSLEALLRLVSSIAERAAGIGNETQREMARLGDRRTALSAYTRSAA
jgi:hypothetical protein